MREHIRSKSRFRALLIPLAVVGLGGCTAESVREAAAERAVPASDPATPGGAYMLRQLDVSSPRAMLEIVPRVDGAFDLHLKLSQVRWDDASGSAVERAGELHATDVVFRDGAATVPAAECSLHVRTGVGAEIRQEGSCAALPEGVSASGVYAKALSYPMELARPAADGPRAVIRLTRWASPLDVELAVSTDAGIATVAATGVPFEGDGPATFAPAEDCRITVAAVGEGFQVEQDGPCAQATGGEVRFDGLYAELLGVPWVDGLYERSSEPVPAARAMLEIQTAGATTLQLRLMVGADSAEVRPFETIRVFEVAGEAPYWLEAAPGCRIGVSFARDVVLLVQEGTCTDGSGAPVDVTGTYARTAPG